MKSEENIAPADLTLLINVAAKIMGEYNDRINKLNVAKDIKNKRHARLIFALDRRIYRYLKAMRQEQTKIDKFKKISARFEIKLPGDETPPVITIPTESVSVVNENTGENVQLTESEIESLRSLTTD